MTKIHGQSAEGKGRAYALTANQVRDLYEGLVIATSELAELAREARLLGEGRQVVALQAWSRPGARQRDIYGRSYFPVRSDPGGLETARDIIRALKRERERVNRFLEKAERAAATALQASRGPRSIIHATHELASLRRGTSISLLGYEKSHSYVVLAFEHASQMSRHFPRAVKHDRSSSWPSETARIAAGAEAELAELEDELVHEERWVVDSLRAKEGGTAPSDVMPLQQVADTLIVNEKTIRGHLVHDEGARGLRCWGRGGKGCRHRISLAEARAWLGKPAE